jgi:hypothetical protein
MNVDFASLDKTEFALLALIFQKSVVGESPDKLTLGAGRLVGAEVETPLPPLSRFLSIP